MPGAQETTVGCQFFILVYSCWSLRRCMPLRCRSMRLICLTSTRTLFVVVIFVNVLMLSVIVARYMFIFTYIRRTYCCCSVLVSYYGNTECLINSRLSIGMYLSCFNLETKETFRYDSQTVAYYIHLQAIHSLFSRESLTAVGAPESVATSVHAFYRQCRGV